MASYTITGRDVEMLPVVAVSIGAIDQEQQIVPEITIVNAVRDCLAAVPGVRTVVAKRYEQVITVI
ncbi:hypothetical protein AB0E62_27520 [Streptomyces sp. NPDC038707]|uniref:hypothetical protein n=1 Tax=Streptomyces sp. NPDC038707 TaxID=3154329 RepID=UPI0033E670E7